MKFRFALARALHGQPGRICKLYLGLDLIRQRVQSGEVFESIPCRTVAVEVYYPADRAGGPFPREKWRS